MQDGSGLDVAESRQAMVAICVGAELGVLLVSPGQEALSRQTAELSLLCEKLLHTAGQAVLA